MEVYQHTFNWTGVRRPVPWLWIRSAEVQGAGGGGGAGNVVRRMGTQQQQYTLLAFVSEISRADCSFQYLNVIYGHSTFQRLLHCVRYLGPVVQN